ncbi:MAG: hypothetical protein QXR60_00740 [Candidatus Nanoarchaeia archaeon]
MKEEKAEMHVGLEQPNERRKEILSSAISTIEILKRYESFKKIKKEKELYKKQLRKTNKEIKTMFKEVNEMMPHMEIVKEERKEPKKITPQVKVAVKKKPEIIVKPVKKEKHLEKLNRDLEELRSKIERL